MAVQGTPELRKKLKRFNQEYWQVNAQIREIEEDDLKQLREQLRGKPLVYMNNGKLHIELSRPNPPALPKYPEYPEECRGMTCAAKTRKGTPCKITDLYDNGRCKFHGGASTGPKTKQGKKRSAMNGLKPKRRDRDKKQVRMLPTSPQQSEPHVMDNIQARLPQGSDRMNSGANPMQQSRYSGGPAGVSSLKAKLMDC